MLYQISKGSKSYGSDEIFSDIYFEIKSNEKIAIVGRNGCGKSTLLKCIYEIESLDKGEIHKPNNLKIGYLSQTTLSDENKTVKEEIEEVFSDIFILKEELIKLENLMKENHSDEILKKYSNIQEQFEKRRGYDYKSEMMMVFTKFGFKEEDLYKEIKTFSGGQKTRIAFVKLLLEKPDILLLDEPTNHLDLNTIQWLETYLKRYPNAVVIVSHDRMFIDDIVDVVYEIEYGVMKKYSGNYTYFTNKKKEDLERLKSEYTRQQKEIERLEDLIEKFRYKKSKASFAQSKIKYLERMDKIDNPKDMDTKTFKAKFIPKVKGGKTVLTIENLKIGYDRELCDITLKIHQGMKIAVLGDNGTGKSTFLKTIMNKIPQISGEYLFGHQIEVGYFDQQLSDFNSSKTVLEELWDEYPNLDKTTIRTVLGQFLFSSDDVFKNVNVLSGGEKVRLSFAKLLLKQPNFLVMDEPTNHLDIIGKEALELSLKDYEGTILFVSHDRYFIKQIATSLLIIENDKVTYYDKNYNEYLEKINIEEKPQKKQEIKNVYIKPKNIKKEISKIENEIEKLEKILKEKTNLRFEPEYYNDYKKSNELEQEIKELENNIEVLMNKWENLSDN